MEDDRIIKLSDRLSVIMDDGNLVLVNITTGTAQVISPEEVKGLKKALEVSC